MSYRIRKCSNHHKKRESSSCERDCQNVIDLINTKFPCTAPFPISFVPFIIALPGEYCLIQDLTYTGNGAAITVLADNVTINFENHRLNLTDILAKGIRADNVDNITINQADIRLPQDVRSFDVSSSAIFLNGVSHGLINGGYFLHTGVAVALNDSNDIKLLNVFSEDMGQSHHTIVGTNGVVIDGAVSTNLVNDLLLGGIFVDEARNFVFKNSQLINVDIFLLSGVGFIIENIENIIDDPNYTFTNFQLGSTEIPVASDVRVSNSIFRRDNAQVASNLTSFGGFNGVIIEDSILEYNYTGDPVNNFAGIFNIVPNIADANNIVIRNNIGRGNAFNAVFIGNFTGTSIANSILIENNQLSGSSDDAIFVAQANNWVIAKNQITGAANNGINVDSDATNGAILKNVITGNAGNGIFLNAGIENNLVQNNKVFGNGGGIVDNGTNVVENNTVFNNLLLAAAKTKKSAKIVKSGGRRIRKSKK